MIRELKSAILRNIINVPGFHTNRKIVVFESDDWGSIRMPSRKVYDQLSADDIRFDNCPYNRYDSLASEDDLTSLFELLLNHRDKDGKHPIFTVNTVVANPDFEKIKLSGFNDYHYEPFTKTLEKYPDHKNSFKLWKQGIKSNIFEPQFHGREHINVKRWMRSLQNNNALVKLAFRNQMYDLSENERISKISFMDALNFEETNELQFQKKAISEGLDIFEDIFGYKASSFIPPCFIMSNNLNSQLATCGIKSIQGNYYQLEPLEGKEHNFKKHLRYLGKKNNVNQTYLMRNAFFEPSSNPTYNWNDDVMKRAASSFFWRKPLIISSHRMNYIGYIDPKNRERNLLKLDRLLKDLLTKWPNIEFMSSSSLNNIISKK